MEDWQRYQWRIYDKLRSEFPDCEIQHDVRIPGRMSGIDRQVDVTIRGHVGGYDLLGAVECRNLSRPLDVTAVDRFRGFLEDIGADFGIMFTTRGYSEAALNRARHAHIKLDLVSYVEIDVYHFEWEICEMCDPGPEHPPPFIELEAPIALVKDAIASVFQIGRCSYCNGISVKCWACGEVMPVWESQYHSPLECRGECGVNFIVRSEHVGEGIFEESVEFIGYEGTAEGAQRFRV